MKNCLKCNYARWNLTKTGRLSPTGEGHCTKAVERPILPNAFYWIGCPSAGGGSIHRKTEYQMDCPFYEERKA